jgi:hypothetical protein
MRCGMRPHSWAPSTAEGELAVWHEIGVQEESRSSEVCRSRPLPSAFSGIAGAVNPFPLSALALGEIDRVSWVVDSQ